MCFHLLVQSCSLTFALQCSAHLEYARDTAMHAAADANDDGLATEACVRPRTWRGLPLSHGSTDSASICSAASRPVSTTAALDPVGQSSAQVHTRVSAESLCLAECKHVRILDSGQAVIYVQEWRVSRLIQQTIKQKYLI